jgi:hypothetical protein
MVRSNLLYLSAAAIALAATALPAAGQAVAPPPVPADIQVPSGNTAYLKGYAMGTQNYVCLPGDAGLAWKFQGPQATVFYKFRWLGSDVLQQIITHFLSPNPMETGAPARATWQSSLDTSTVWAKKVKESSDPAYVAAGAIPWFLLQTTGVRSGPTGGASLTQTTYIQRVNTTGGTLSGACSEAGSIQFVPYTAEYVFYQTNGSH